MEKENLPLDEQFGHNKYIPGVSVSCVAFCFSSGVLKLLLGKYKTGDKWILPAGFIAQDEDVDEAILRILKEKTGVKDPYLKQFSFFGNKERVDAINASKQANMGRFINLAYYSFIKEDEVKLPKLNEEELRWFDIKEIPNTYADHKEIIDICMQTIRQQIGFLPLGYGLLPEKFTMPELRTIYETILERELDRRNFQRKMLSIGYIKPLNETRKIGAHKSPNLYTFEKDKYDEAARLGLQIMSNNL